MKNEIILNNLSKLLEIDRGDLNLNSPLSGYVNWDSLALVSMIATIDEHFNVLLKGYEIEQCKTANDIFLMVENKIKNVNAA